MAKQALSEFGNILETLAAASNEVPEPDVGGDENPEEVLLSDSKVSAVQKKKSAGSGGSGGSGGRMTMTGPVQMARVSPYYLFATGPPCVISIKFNPNNKLVFEDEENLMRSGHASAVATHDVETNAEIPIYSTSPMQMRVNKQTLVPVGVTISIQVRCALPGLTASKATDPAKVADPCKRTQVIEISFFRPQSGVDVAGGLCVPLAPLAELVRVTPEQLQYTLQPDQVAELPLQLDAVSAAVAGVSTKNIKVVSVQGVMQALLLIDLQAEYQITKSSSDKSSAGTKKLYYRRIPIWDLSRIRRL